VRCAAAGVQLAMRTDRRPSGEAVNGGGGAVRRRLADGLGYRRPTQLHILLKYHKYENYSLKRPDDADKAAARLDLESLPYSHLRLRPCPSQCFAVF